MAGIALFRALKLGDLLCAVPAFRAVRLTEPDPRITLIGLPWAAGFAARYRHLFDDFIAFPGWPGMPEQPPGDPTAFLARARERVFDLAVQMHGSGGVTNGIVAALGAAHTAGFGSPGAAPLDDVLPYPDDLHEVRRHLALADHLGFSSAGEALEFPITDEDRAEAASLGIDGAGPVAVVHCGAISGRRWPAGRFARVTEALARGTDVVLTGSAAERDATGHVASLAGAPVRDLAGRTTLGSLAAVIERARIVVTNDTGVSHLTAAIGTPSVVLFLSSDPRRWAPLDAQRHRAVTHPAITAAHAAHPERAGALPERCIADGCERHPGLLDADPGGVEVDAVLAAIDAVTARGAVGAPGRHAIT
ncbi:MAG TPA: glycosyltransferase family 9 protein [Actinomycetota bacterium]|nr:glycosyltransferase family 9 protein [Actinomycetota bacterium]